MRRITVRSASQRSMRTFASMMRRALPERPMAFSFDPRRDHRAHRLQIQVQNLGSAPDRDELLLERGSDESMKPVFDEVLVTEALGLLSRESLRFIALQERLSEPRPIRELELLPDPLAVGPLLGKPIQDGPVAHAENPLYLEHAIDERETPRLVPLQREHVRRHEEVARELLGFLLLFTVLFSLGDVVRPKVEKKVSELVRGGEDPPLDGDSLPDVHDDGRPAVVLR